jgi:hypothetical protein
MDMGGAMTVVMVVMMVVMMGGMAWGVVVAMRSRSRDKHDDESQ